MYKLINKFSVKVFLCCFGYVMFSGFVQFFVGSGLFMAWNLFLAALPMLFAMITYKIAEAEQWTAVRIILILFCGGVWLLLFPNSPYMVTDLIHVDMNGSNHGGQDILQWLDLVHIGIGLILSTLAGMYSLYLMRKIVDKKFGKILGWIFCVIVCGLTGFGIYIGRFLRFNSWDIFNPVRLISVSFKSLDVFAFEYILLIAFYTLCIYLIFHVFFVKEKNAD